MANLERNIRRALLRKTEGPRGFSTQQFYLAEEIWNLHSPQSTRREGEVVRPPWGEEEIATKFGISVNHVKLYLKRTEILNRQQERLEEKRQTLAEERERMRLRAEIWNREKSAEDTEVEDQKPRGIKRKTKNSGRKEDSEKRGTKNSLKIETRKRRPGGQPDPEVARRREFVIALWEQKSPRLSPEDIVSRAAEEFGSYTRRTLYSDVDRARKKRAVDKRIKDKSPNIVKRYLFVAKLRDENPSLSVAELAERIRAQFGLSQEEYPDHKVNKDAYFGRQELKGDEGSISQNRGGRKFSWQVTARRARVALLREQSGLTDEELTETIRKEFKLPKYTKKHLWKDDFYLRRRDASQTWMETFMASSPGASFMAIRLAQGFTQEEYSARAGISVSTIAHIETGKTSPTLKTINRYIQNSPLEYLGKESQTLRLLTNRHSPLSLMTEENLATCSNGYLLQYERIARGESGIEIAKLMGCSTAMMSRVEANRLNKPELVDSYLEVFKIPATSDTAKLMLFKATHPEGFPVPQDVLTGTIREGYILTQYDLSQKEKMKSNKELSESPITIYDGERE